jgi:type II secretory pathway component PulF
MDLGKPMTPNPSDKHLFYSEMAKLLEAGFDIRRAATVLLDTGLPASLTALLRDLHDGLDAGESITAAFSRKSERITALERSIIGAGERGGKLGPAFQHLADYFGMLASTRRDAVKSLIYPLVILHLGVFLGTVPGALLLGKLDFLEIALRLVSTLLGLYAAGFAGYLAVRQGFRLAPVHATADRWINWIPWVGKARRNSALARFCKVYHSCLLAGISMEETVKLSAEASQSGLMREAGQRLAATVKAGNPLGPAFLRESAFPKAFTRSYATGEEAGTLDADLARWAALARENAAASAKAVSVMLPKALYFCILGFVAWKIVGFYQGYYSAIFEQLEP